MSETPQADDIVDDGVTDVLAEDDIAHVTPGSAEMAEAIEHRDEPSFIADVPDWDKQDHAP